MASFFQLPPQDIATKILLITQSYVTIVPKKKPKKCNATTTAKHSIHLHKHSNRGLPNHTIILLLTAYMPNTTHTTQLATQSRHNLRLIQTNKIL